MTVLFHFRNVKHSAAFAAGLVLTPIHLVPIANGTVCYRVEGTRPLFTFKSHAERYATNREAYLARLASRCPHCQRGTGPLCDPCQNELSREAAFETEFEDARDVEFARLDDACFG